MGLFGVVGILAAFMLYFDAQAKKNMVEKSYGSDFFTKWNGNVMAYFQSRFMCLFTEKGQGYIKKVKALIIMQLIVAILMIFVSAHKG